jgi:Tfp pilus assembly protein PilN
MINLLPTEMRQSTRYAYKNTRLRKYVVAMLLLLVSVVLVFLGGAVYLRQNTRAIASQVESTQKQLEIEDQSKIKAEIQDLSDTLKLVVQVLSDQVLFSRLITQLGSIMPNGSALSSLSINELNGGLDLQVKAFDFDTATQVQVNFEDPDNSLFKSVDIINIQCQNSSEAQATGYPCTVKIRVLFDDTSKFLLINNGAEDE